MNMIVGPATVSASAKAIGKSAAAFPQLDPIHTAIEACRTTKQALDAVEDGAHAERLALALLDLYEKFAETIPTTPEGVLAKLAFYPVASARNPDVFDDEAMLSTVTTAAKVLLAA
jgi:hypothetical protein